MKSKKRLAPIEGKIDVNKPFTLYLNNEPHKFENMMEFTTKTKISSAVAQDLLNGDTIYPFKGWSKEPITKPDFVVV
jgi:uroporphyrinogen-III decarboxylase